jgi:glycosyltransferase involved in cell wall biosynthesis
MTFQPRLVFLCCEGLAAAVIPSQVVRTIEQLHERGHDFDLFLFANLGVGLLQHRQNLVRIEKTRPSIPGDMPFVYLLAFDPVSVAYAQWRLQRWLEPDLRSGRPIFLHCRAEYATHVAAPLARYPNVRILADIRDEKVANYDYWQKTDANALDRLLYPLKRRKFIGWQKECAHVADRIHCVCEPLVEYFRENYPESSPKLELLRTGADDRRFRFDPESRRRMRERLGFGDKRVFVYSGSLNTYQMIDETLDFFAYVHRHDPNSHLLFLTPDTSPIPQKLAARGLDESSFTLASVAVHEVPEYLMAADFGILFRADEPTSYYASPIKLGEYWLCGLPIIVAPAVRDSLPTLAKHPWMGIPTDPENPDGWSDTLDALRSETFANADRMAIREVGLQGYSRSHYLDAYESLIDEWTKETAK